jgi:phosphate transport system substrate-binding protein
MALKIRSGRLVGMVSLVAVLGLAACAGGGTEDTATDTGTDTQDTASAPADGGDEELSGDVLVDGSSTVFPISEAMAEEFMAANPGVRVTVGVSGTGGGFQKFCNGETDVSNASRPIKEEEIALCAENGIEYVEMPVAFDGLSVVVSNENDWAQCLTVDELKMIWEPAAEGVITNWNQVRPEFPDRPLSLYGAGTDSGTFDYFTENIVGEESASRGDYTASEDDNVIVQGVISDANSLGYFGYAYYIENEGEMKLLEVDNGEGCVAPDPETIADGSYVPLSRPEFFYVKVDSLDNPAVKAFTEFQISQDNAYLVSEVGYVPVIPAIAELTAQRLADVKTGSVYEGAEPGAKLRELMEAN